MSNTCYHKIGDIFTVTNKESIDLRETLPVGNYTVKVSDKYGLYLQPVESFQLPKKLYGDVTSRADRMLNTFLDRPSATGIMLAGEKGSGKSLLAKTLSIEGAKRGIITIIINESFHGDNFNTFMQEITQPAIILFDEFEKVYDKEEQESILTLLDGVYPTKKLFVITCNDKWKVDVNMRNRPGRIFYMLDYEGLDAKFIREYCQDVLKNKSHIDRVCQLVSFFDKFNFDMLKALVEEMNRYNEGPESALDMLNIKPEYGGKVTYDIQLFIDDHAIDKKDNVTDAVAINIINEPFGIEYTPFDNKKKRFIESKSEYLVFRPSDIINISESAGVTYVHSEKSNFKIVLTKKPIDERPRYLDF